MLATGPRVLISAPPCCSELIMHASVRARFSGLFVCTRCAKTPPTSLNHTPHLPPSLSPLNFVPSLTPPNYIPHLHPQPTPPFSQLQYGIRWYSLLFFAVFCCSLFFRACSGMWMIHLVGCILPPLGAAFLPPHHHCHCAFLGSKIGFSFFDIFEHATDFFFFFRFSVLLESYFQWGMFFTWDFFLHAVAHFFLDVLLTFRLLDLDFTFHLNFSVSQKRLCI